MRTKMNIPKVATAIYENHFMDDYLDSFPIVEKAKQVVNDVITVHEKGGFVHLL